MTKVGIESGSSSRAYSLSFHQSAVFGKLEVFLRMERRWKDAQSSVLSLKLGVGDKEQRLKSE